MARVVLSLGVAFAVSALLVFFLGPLQTCASFTRVSFFFFSTEVCGQSESIAGQNPNLVVGAVLLIVSLALIALATRKGMP
jgi:Na+/H+ antiporter NhaC